MDAKSRKEIHLGKQTLTVLSKLANYEGRSLKNYMERVLIKHANDNKDPFAFIKPHKQ